MRLSFVFCCFCVRFSLARQSFGDDDYQMEHKFDGVLGLHYGAWLVGLYRR